MTHLSSLQGDVDVNRHAVQEAHTDVILQDRASTDKTDGAGLHTLHLSNL